MTSVLYSFLALICLPVALALVVAGVGKLWFQKPWPSARGFARDSVISAGLTAAVILGICLILSLTGFTESHFYRPSAKDYGEQTRLRLAPEDAFFESEDGIRLSGWFFPAQEKAFGTVIHFHGSDRNITHTIKNSHWLTRRGFNLFVFDYRGYGKSQGQPSRRGMVEDARAAIEYVRSRPEVDPAKIVLWGQSMGGQLAIVGADAAGTEGIQAVVAEATYASHAHHVKDKLAGMGPLWLIQWGVWLVTSDEHAALDVVNRLTPSNLLLVHGSADRGVRPYHSEWLFEAAKDPKDIWRVQGARHLEVFHDTLHRDQLVQFFKQALKRTESSIEQNTFEPGGAANGSPPFSSM